MSFNRKMLRTLKTEPKLILKKSGRHRHGERTVDEKHRYCAHCDIFWCDGYSCGGCEFANINEEATA